MNYKAIWNLSREDLKKATNAAQRLEAAKEYVNDMLTSMDDLTGTINDAANIFSLDFFEYSEICDALEDTFRFK